jgi:hypothetical protein
MSSTPLPPLDESSTGFFIKKKPSSELAFAAAIYRDGTMQLYVPYGSSGAKEEPFPPVPGTPSLEVVMTGIDSMAVLYTKTAVWTWWTSQGVRKCWWI